MPILALKLETDNVFDFHKKEHHESNAIITAVEKEDAVVTVNDTASRNGKVGGGAKKIRYGPFISYKGCAYAFPICGGGENEDGDSTATLPLSNDNTDDEANNDSLSLYLQSVEQRMKDYNSSKNSPIGSNFLSSAKESHPSSEISFDELLQLKRTVNVKWRHDPYTHSLICKTEATNNAIVQNKPAYAAEYDGDDDDNAPCEGINDDSYHQYGNPTMNPFYQNSYDYNDYETADYGMQGAYSSPSVGCFGEIATESALWEVCWSRDTKSPAFGFHVVDKRSHFIPAFSPYNHNNSGYKQRSDNLAKGHTDNGNVLPPPGSRTTTIASTGVCAPSQRPQPKIIIKQTIINSDKTINISYSSTTSRDNNCSGVFNSANISKEANGADPEHHDDYNKKTAPPAVSSAPGTEIKTEEMRDLIIQHVDEIVTRPDYRVWGRRTFFGYGTQLKRINFLWRKLVHHLQFTDVELSHAVKTELGNRITAFFQGHVPSKSATLEGTDDDSTSNADIIYFYVMISRAGYSSCDSGTTEQAKRMGHDDDEAVEANTNEDGACEAPRHRLVRAFSFKQFKLGEAVLFDGDMGLEVARVQKRIRIINNKQAYFKSLSSHNDAGEDPNSSFFFFHESSAVNNMRPFFFNNKDSFLSRHVYRGLTANEEEVIYNEPGEIGRFRELDPSGFLPLLEREVLRFLQSLTSNPQARRLVQTTFPGCAVENMSFTEIRVQADGGKCTACYQESSPVRFIELATFLYSIIPCRIWFQKVNSL